MATEGILRVSKKIPTDNREWEQFLRRLNTSFKHDGERAVIEAITTLSERTGTDFETLLSLITDEGRAENQRFLNMITFGNAPSLQSTIPITASADATTAEIQVGAHDLHYGGITLSYASGDISGLLPSTDYYVYTDDPDLEGGTVTYQATTSYINLSASKHRYLVGGIRTPVSSIAAAMSAATQANPCVVTTGAAHGFTTGDQIDFSGVVGMIELNPLSPPVITVLSPTTFSLNGVNSTAFAAYVSGGTATRVSTPADGLGGGAGYGYIYDLSIYY